MFSDNEIFVAAASLAAAAHAAALIWYLRSRRVAMALTLNIVLAVMVLAYLARRARYILAGPVDEQQIALFVFELAALAAACWGFGGARLPVAFSWLAFGLHFAASAAALFLVATLRFTRLF